MPAVVELAAAYQAARRDRSSARNLDYYLRDYAGRPTPLTFAERLTRHCGGAKIYLKREDLLHTGAHKINNTLGQALLARRMGKKRVIAETGAGQHGVATAVVAALFGFECAVYMGEEDIRRQALNVFRMRMLGASVVPVRSGSRTLKDAMNEAMRDWMATVRDDALHHRLGRRAASVPDDGARFPVRDRPRDAAPVLRKEGRLPDALVACVGGGSNAAGMFYPFVEDKAVQLIGVEAAGLGLESGLHAATLMKGSVGVLHGSRSYVLQDAEGQTLPVHSVSAGLDYPGVGPEHSYWKETGRAKYVSATDQQALDAFGLLSRLEGIIPALESAHAVAHAAELAAKMKPEEVLVICLSGRGDKDCVEVAEKLGQKL